MTRDTLLKTLEQIDAIAYRAVGGRGMGTELKKFAIGLLTFHAGEIAEAVQAYRHGETEEKKEANAFQTAVTNFKTTCIRKGYSRDKSPADDEDVTKAAELLKFSAKYRYQHDHSLTHYQIALSNFAGNDKTLYDAAAPWAPS
ncbi:MAG TPA: hypothetical protein VHC00_02610 [Rhizobiaceae bacterium]|nr:hypothetical protein [Rhizobiaceae bacterium]